MSVFQTVQAILTDTSKRVSSRRCASSGQVNECLGATPVRLCVKARWFGVVSGCSSDVTLGVLTLSQL
jgi:hypothetical protein